MENKEQILFLARTAFRSKNYIQAFDYYSKLLENDINNKEFWLGKALATAHLSTLDNPKTNEAVVCIKTAMEMSELTEEEKEKVSEELIETAEQKITEGILQIDREAEKRFNEKQMGTFTTYPVHQLNRIVVKMDVGKQYRTALTDYFDLLEIAYELCPTEENITKLQENMSRVLKHSANNQNYFGALNELTEENKRINRLWNKASKKLSEVSPGSWTPKPTTPTSSNEGCFIATAAAGNYNHPTVLQLRHFRDNTLARTIYGRRFIKFYYAHSPRMAAYIKTKKTLRKVLYFTLIKPLSLLTKLFD